MQSPQSEITPPSSRVEPEARHLIYMIERRSDGRRYVGLTARSIHDRLRAHAYDAMRHGRSRAEGSLAAAVRQTILAGRSLDDDFRWAILQSGLTAEQARQAEALWIDRLECWVPEGFNKMPAGSLGGPGNARRITFVHPIKGEVTYSSLYAAIAMRNAELLTSGHDSLLPSTVYFRVAQGWTAEAALGYASHVDGRGDRGAVRYANRYFRSLREISEETGESVEALRSRLHRSRRNGVTDPDLAVDRRADATPRRIILLPDPGDPSSAARLHVNEFCARTGVPRTTVVHRIGQLMDKGHDPEAMDQAELVRVLTTEEDRRTTIGLTLPDGQVLVGGVRQLVRQVLADDKLAQSRPQQLGDSAIRARLRKIDHGDPAQIQWAFGFVAP